MISNRSVFLLIAVLGLWSCGKREKPQQEKPARVVKVPEFSADSAYLFTENQVKFGPRIPNTLAHEKAGDYLVRSLKNFGARVSEQKFQATTFDNQKISLRNIIASYEPDRQKRILLAAHWDTRPFSDKDPSKPNATFDGANDGASGVGVLLEIARVLGKSNPPDVGIDIILFDGEDWGERDGATESIRPPEGLDSWWCLGSQYWSKHKHKAGYTAFYGILLDMVGAKNAHFFKEGYSVDYAPRIVEKVWSAASRLGKSSLFVNQREAAITDDHRFVNEMANIPMIDIVHFDPVKGYFGDFHHTQKDNMSLIAKESLGATGTVLLNVIYYEE
jgi:glutaminyl-peptide cyclotransferase